MPSMFVTFEGLDGSGKSTQAELLRVRLEADGVDVVSTREPGGTELGERVRDLVLHGGHVTPWAEALLYAAARAQHVDEVIRPALERGASVICDRYLDSSVAYQGVGRELGLERVLELNLAAVGGLLPDRTFLLSLEPAEIGSRLGGVHDRLERQQERPVGGLLPDRTFLLSLEPAEIGSRLGGVHDRLERESEEFHARAAAAYRDLAGRFPERIVVLDAARPPDELAEEVYGSLRVSA